MSKIVLILKSSLEPPNVLFIEINDEHGNSINTGEYGKDGEYDTLTIDCDKFASTIDTKHLKQLDDVTAIAVSPGNADANDYLRGMANGLILAQSIFEDTEPKYIEPSA